MRNRLRPRPSAISGSDRASTSSTSPQPLVMNRLTPRTNQLPSASCQTAAGRSCSASWAETFTAWRSLPASGSVRTIAPVSLPDAIGGRYWALISSEAKALIVSAMPWSP